MSIEATDRTEARERIELKEPASVQSWVRAHPLYKDAAGERDALAERVAELESLLAAADGMHRVAMGAVEKRLSRAEEQVQVATSANTLLREEVRELVGRLSTEQGESNLCA